MFLYWNKCLYSSLVSSWKNDRIKILKKKLISIKRINYAEKWTNKWTTKIKWITEIKCMAIDSYLFSRICLLTLLPPTFPLPSPSPPTLIPFCSFVIVRRKLTNNSMTEVIIKIAWPSVRSVTNRNCWCSNLLPSSANCLPCHPYTVCVHVSAFKKKKKKKKKKINTVSNFSSFFSLALSPYSCIQ